jgi:hypothetical protein
MGRFAPSVSRVSYRCVRVVDDPSTPSCSHRPKYGVVPAYHRPAIAVMVQVMFDPFPPDAAPTACDASAVGAVFHVVVLDQEDVAG